MPVIYKGRQSSIANKEGERLYYPYVVSTRQGLEGRVCLAGHAARMFPARFGP